MLSDNIVRYINYNLQKSSQVVNQIYNLILEHNVPTTDPTFGSVTFDANTLPTVVVDEIVRIVDEYKVNEDAIINNKKQQGLWKSDKPINSCNNAFIVLPKAKIISDTLPALDRDNCKVQSIVLGEFNPTVSRYKSIVLGQQTLPSVIKACSFEKI